MLFPEPGGPITICPWGIADATCTFEAKSSEGCPMFARQTCRNLQQRFLQRVGVLALEAIIPFFGQASPGTNPRNNPPALLHEIYSCNASFESKGMASWRKGHGNGWLEYLTDTRNVDDSDNVLADDVTAEPIISRICQCNVRHGNKRSFRRHYHGCSILRHFSAQQSNPPTLLHYMASGGVVRAKRFVNQGFPCLPKSRLLGCIVVN